MSTSIDTALIDGDIIIYAAGFGAERVQYKLFFSDKDVEQDTPALISPSRKDIKTAAEGKEGYVVHKDLDIDPLEYALHKTKLILEKIIGHTDCKKMRVFLTGEGNFRKDIATYRKYKGNRDFAKRPYWYHSIIEYLTKYWDAVTIEGEEADDALGIYQMQSRENTVICSTDKDLLQIPGLHYNIMKEKLIYQEPEDAEHIFWSQVLTGDSTDNITGCPGIGKVGAEKFLAKPPSWERTVRAYTAQLSKKVPKDMRYSNGRVQYKHWKDDSEITKTVEEFALEMAQLVHIRKNKGEIWTP